MQFGLSEEQRLLAETLRRYFSEECPITRVRDMSRAVGPEAGTARALWKELAALGVAGILVPEEHGGAGLGLLDAAVAGEILGWGVAPAPYLGTAVMAPVALLEGASQAEQSRWLPAIAAGECAVGVALGELVVARQDAGVVERDGRLHGCSLMAVDAATADLWIVGVQGEVPRLALVDAQDPGLSSEAMATIDRTRSFGGLELAGVEPVAWLEGEAVARTLGAARVVLAADCLGASERALDLAVAYAKQREQFDRVIASFQAVKHLCAEMVAELEPARSLVWYAAHAFDSVPEEAVFMPAHAKAHLSEVGTFIVRAATEVHGGIGFTDEQNLHFWFKRVGVDRQLLGGPDVTREHAAIAQGWLAG